MSCITTLSIPNYPELSVAALYEKVSSDHLLMAYLPDPKEKKKPDKHFVWHLLYYFHKDWIEETIAKAQEARAQYQARQNKERP